MSHWRRTAAMIIDRVLESMKGQDDKAVRKALREAYPFGERAMWPYKIWLDEIRKQTKGRFVRKKDEPVRPLWETGSVSEAQ